MGAVAAGAHTANIAVVFEPTNDCCNILHSSIAVVFVYIKDCCKMLDHAALLTVKALDGDRNEHGY